MKVFEDPEFLELRDKFSEPNIFLFLENAGYEIRHSNFLKWLLDPSETHGHGNFALRLLLRQLGIEVGDAHKFVGVKREQDNIDLLIVFEQLVIAVENKTKTKDSVGQLSRYRQLIASKYTNHDKHFVYWTISGECPSDHEEIEHWKLYSYQKFSNVLDQVCEASSDAKVKFYVQDYLDALKLTLLPENNYVEKAKSVLERHQKELSVVFSKNSSVHPSDAKAIAFLKRNSGYVKGIGFFSPDKPFLNFFETACREHGFKAIPRGTKQTTYFGFWPEKILDSYFQQNELQDIPFSFSFRYLDKKSVLELFFQITPETDRNVRSRMALVSNVGLFQESRSGLPVKSRGTKHIGVCKQRIPFNVMDFGANEIESALNKIFAGGMKDFVEEISETLKLLFDQCS
jgi:hypothetical protein